MNQITIKSIYTASEAGLPMLSCESAMAHEGIGLKNDRYALGIGAFSTTAVGKVRDITFIAQTAIDEANSALAQLNELSYDGGQTRRNVVLTSISAQDLNQLVGKQFQIGEALFVGTELCDPCKRPAKLLGRSNFMQPFKNKGGIRAKVIRSGALTVGAKLIAL